MIHMSLSLNQYICMACVKQVVRRRVMCCMIIEVARSCMHCAIGALTGSIRISYGISCFAVVSKFPAIAFLERCVNDRPRV